MSTSKLELSSNHIELINNPLVNPFSDYTIPRSYRMMKGFGVNTFVLINSKGERTFVKYHWKPHEGTHSLVWDEAWNLAGQDPDFLRRDLAEAIESKAYPKWELGVQLISEELEETLDFDILDCTKLVPEDIVPIKWIGTMTLNKNPTVSLLFLFFLSSPFFFFFFFRFDANDLLEFTELFR